MWTRSKDTNNPGKFAYTLWDGATEIERVGNFDTSWEADRAAERAQRMFLFHPSSFVPASGDNLSIDEILAELDA